MGKLVEAWFDGVCEPRNPGGHAAWGILLKVDGEVIVGRGDYVGAGPTMSNNVAEYSGFNAVMKEILNRKLQGIAVIRGDSALVINQLNRRWKVNGGFYMPYYQIARQLLAQVNGLTGGVRLEWIPRDKNGECDHFSKEVLRQRGIEFRIQPERKRA